MPQWTHQVDMGMMSPAQASVAQLDRVLPSEGRGRGFESRRVHHTNQWVTHFRPGHSQDRDSSVTAARTKKAPH